MWEGESIARFAPPPFWVWIPEYTSVGDRDIASSTPVTNSLLRYAEQASTSQGRHGIGHSSCSGAESLLLAVQNSPSYLPDLAVWQIGAWTETGVELHLKHNLAILLAA